MISKYLIDNAKKLLSLKVRLSNEMRVLGLLTFGFHEEDWKHECYFCRTYANYGKHDFSSIIKNETENPFDASKVRIWNNQTLDFIDFNMIDICPSGQTIISSHSNEVQDSIYLLESILKGEFFSWSNPTFISDKYSIDSLRKEIHKSPIAKVIVECYDKKNRLESILSSSHDTRRKYGQKLAETLMSLSIRNIEFFISGTMTFECPHCKIRKDFEYQPEEIFVFNIVAQKHVEGFDRIWRQNALDVDVGPHPYRNRIKSSPAFILLYFLESILHDIEIPGIKKSANFRYGYENIWAFGGATYNHRFARSELPCNMIEYSELINNFPRFEV